MRGRTSSWAEYELSEIQTHLWASPIRPRSTGIGAWAITASALA